MKNLRGIAASLIICLLAGCTAAPSAVRKSSVVKPLTVQQQADPLEASFQKLADQIVAGLRSQQASQIAVVQFQNLDGSVSEFGGFLAEEMITRLYQTGTFRVVEREMLNRVMAEHELATSGLVDESTAKELGKLLGVDAIATGTITDLGSEVRVNSRLIATETGSVFSVAAATLPKDSRVENLMGKILVSSIGATIPGSPGTAKKVTGANRSGGIFYFEDFSKVDEGQLPSEWVGGTTLAVKPSSLKKGGNCLSNFEKGQHSFTVPNLTFPANWRFEMEAMNLQDPWCNRFKFRIGKDIEVSFVRDYYVGEKTGGVMFLNGIKTNVAAPPRGQLFLIAVEQRDDVVKLFLDGNKVHFVRIPNLEPPTNVSFSYSQDFGIYRLQGTALP